jgi:hypothetical protein
MPEPTSIPLPSVLEPDRAYLLGNLNADEDAEQRVADLQQALADACDYGRQLWLGLDSIRGYLLNSLPSDPHTPGLHRTCAAPTGPDDEDGWQSWMAAYAEAHSVLAGPHGDSGFGVSEAAREAQNRRSAPAVRLIANHPELLPATVTGRPIHTGMRARLPGVVLVAAVTLAAREVLARRLRRP